jgi:hypothetical protein
MIAYVLARHWRPQPIYEALLTQDGIHLGDRVIMGAEAFLRATAPRRTQLSLDRVEHVQRV